MTQKTRSRAPSGPAPSITWLERHARTASRNRALVALAVAVVVLVVVAAHAGYLRQYAAGPQALTATQLQAARAGDGLADRWVRVDSARSIDTGIVQETVRSKRGVERSRSVTAYYHLAQIGEDRWLLVKSPLAQPGVRLHGTLVAPDGAAARLPLAGQLLPVMLDTSPYRAYGHWLLGIAAALLLAAAFGGLLAWQRMHAPARHPALARLAAGGPLAVVSRIVQRESKSPEAVRIGRWRITPNHALHKHPLLFDVRPLNDLLWVYAQATQHKLWYVIPTGTTFSLVLRWRDATVRLPAKQAEVEGALACVLRNQPWVVFGHNKELETAYRRNPNAFAQDVRQRRAAWLRQQQEPASVEQAAPPPPDERDRPLDYVP